MEFRIYVKGKVVNICSDKLIYNHNLIACEKKYGKDIVTVKKLVKPVMDQEKVRWLKSIENQ